MRIAREHSQTKEKLLDAAQRLMLAKGFEATSVEEICEAAKLTKGSFFHYFETKEELGKAVLEHFCRQQQERMQAGPFHQKRDPLERIDGMLDFMIQMSKEPMAKHGCLLGTFSQELAETHPEIRRCCAEQFQGWVEGLKRDLDKAKATYAPKDHLDTQSLAQHLIAIMEGSMILVKANQDATVMAKNLRHFQRYLHTLFKGRR